MNSHYNKFKAPKVSELLGRVARYGAVAGIALGLSACSVESDADGSLLSKEQSVQEAFVRLVGVSGQTPAFAVGLAKGLADYSPGHAAGALRPLGENWPVAAGEPYAPESTCGLTFLSPTMAVTAAHCVDKGRVPRIKGQSNPSKFRVEQVRLDLNMAAAPVQEQATAYLAKTYNGSTYLAQWDEITAADGYNLTKYTDCVVVSRCAYGSDANQRDNCPDYVNNGVTSNMSVDVAMIECPSRANHSYYKNKFAKLLYKNGPANTESDLANPFTNGNADYITNWWYHEVVDTYSEDGGGNTYLSKAKYFDLDSTSTAGYQKNWHYYSWGEDLEMFPLYSDQRAGQRYQSLGYQPTNSGTDTRYVETNLPSCHGTSGSGVFRNISNSWYFVGPVVTNPNLGTKLCDDMTSTSTRSRYTRDGYSAILYKRHIE